MPTEEIAGVIQRGPITYLPVVPGRIEFASHVRRHLLESRPQIVAVELPTSLESPYRKALERLPRMSVILIPDDDDRDQDKATFIPIEPGDPFVEAMRTALDIDAEIVFLEPAAQARPHLNDMYPEPFAAEIVGMGKYVEAYRVHPQPTSRELSAHAAAMAWKLQGANPLATIAVVVSLNMLDPLLEGMELPRSRPQHRARGFLRGRSCLICIRIAWRK